MAIYHLHVRIGNKARGDSALKRVKRLMCLGKHARHLDELACAEAANLPSWATSAQHFWKASDTYERANAVLYREVEVSLPRELDEEAQIELSKRLAVALTESHDLPYTLSVFRGSSGNPRAHVMMCERQDDGGTRGESHWFKQRHSKNPEKGGAPKLRALRSKSWLFGTRELWANLANEALAEHGFDERIDHRSYKEQGIEKTPQIHLGSAVHAMKARGVETERGQLHDEIEVLREHEQLELELEAQVVELTSQVLT